MPCPPCMIKVPAVSTRLANEVVLGLDPGRRTTALLIAMAWLTTGHADLHVYAGITGRLYNEEEREAIAAETGIVAGLPCPFNRGGTCVLGGLGPRFTPKDEAGHLRYGWLPTLVARAIDRRTLTELTERGLVADAKVALLTRNTAFPTKEMQVAS